MFRQIRNFILGFGLLLHLANFSSFSQSPPPSEYQLKAAFIYNFAKFTDWPPEAFADEKAPFVIGILGDDPFGSNLERTVAGKTVNSHPIVIQIFRNPSDAAGCHLLFISTSMKGKFAEVFKKLQGTSILTVGETEQFIQAGGIINFVEEAKKIRFQINETAARAARLKMSSKLLSLAISSNG